ncbi:MAG: aldehyde dehydrogenase family protein [Desulfobaccales bacterium]|jgi:acyl-CoA reductase-like NAD-dependent aldehyde dehydrogenase
MTFEQRFEKVRELIKALGQRREQMIAQAALDLQFAAIDTDHEVDLTMDRLGNFLEVREALDSRRPLGRPDSWVAVALSYNGSAWLNLVITAAYMAGNRVLVKLSSKGSGLSSLMEEIYQPIFGDGVRFYRDRGRSFMEEALKNPKISGMVFFGFDQHVLPYQEAFRQSGKKFIFEGPGSDPFIVFPDADLSQALADLMAAKFAYSGQTCTAPKRIFIHEAVYEQFLKMIAPEVEGLRVGDPTDRSVQVTPLASGLAVAGIKAALSEAAARGAQILVGGKIAGNLVYPTLIRDATDDLLGMKNEIFGPVLFTSSFSEREVVVARAQNHQYGLRAAVYGGEEAALTAAALRGEKYCHPVPDYTFGKFGTVSLNEPRAESWRGALVTKAVGGYGYSGWIWETVEGRFQIKQGPKLIHLETSLPA